MRFVRNLEDNKRPSISKWNWRSYFYVYYEEYL